MIQERLNEKPHVIVEWDKDEPKNWSEHPYDLDPDFQEEFDHIVSNKEVT